MNSREDERLEQVEPEQDDYIIYDSGYLGSLTSVSMYDDCFLNEWNSREEAEQGIQEYARAHHWWANVWFQDNHGGLTLIDDFWAGVI